MKCNSYSNACRSWNEMINGYAQNGLGERAIGVFEQMLRAKEKPDSVTFISVMNAYSHCGLVDEGIEILESMERCFEGLRLDERSLGTEKSRV